MRIREPTDSTLISLGAPYSVPADNEIALLKNQLCTFSGSCEDWPRVAVQFRFIVHENLRIDDCKRFIYLRPCLIQDANAIASLDNRAINYSIAWEILQKRYNEPVKIVVNHLKTLFYMTPLQRPLHRTKIYNPIQRR